MAVGSWQLCAPPSASCFLFVRCNLSATHHQAHVWPLITGAFAVPEQGSVAVGRFKGWCWDGGRGWPWPAAFCCSCSSAACRRRCGASQAAPVCYTTSTSLLLNPLKEAKFSSKQETPQQGETLQIFHKWKNLRRCGALLRWGTGPAAWARARVKGCSAARSPGAALQDGDSSAEKRAVIP